MVFICRDIVEATDITGNDQIGKACLQVDRLSKFSGLISSRI